MSIKAGIPRGEGRHRLIKGNRTDGGGTIDYEISGSKVGEKPDRVHHWPLDKMPQQFKPIGDPVEDVHCSCLTDSKVTPDGERPDKERGDRPKRKKESDS